VITDYAQLLTKTQLCTTAKNAYTVWLLD